MSIPNMASGQAQTFQLPYASAGASSQSPIQNGGPDSTTSRARFHRSRKNRPCDACRKGKARCDIDASGPPCTRCSQLRKECAFNMGTEPRKRPPKPSSSDMADPLKGGQLLADGRLLSGTSGSSHNQRSGHAHYGPGRQREDSAVSRPPSSADVRPFKRARSRDDDDDDDMATPMDDDWYSRRGSRLTDDPDGDNSGSHSPSGLDVLAAAVPSLDHLATSGYEPHVLTNPLTNDLLPIVVDGEGDGKGGSNRDTEAARVKQISSDSTHPTFVVLNPKRNDGGKHSTSAGEKGLRQLRTLIQHHPVEVTEEALATLYYEQVHAAWPVLPKGKIAQLPPYLVSTILAHAFSHSQELRPLAPLATNLINTDCGCQNDSNLAGVAAAVLQLGLRPASDSRESYLLLAKTIALAQLLGLHLNSQHWRLPQWEQELRVRLWWALAIQDAWMSFLNSRPCHIQAQNSNVPLPSLSSVLVASCAFSSTSTDCARAFIASCQLAKHVRRLQADVVALGAVAMHSASERKEKVDQIASRVDELLNKEWRDIAFSGTPRPTGVASFLLHILGFRCMLKRIAMELQHGFGNSFDPDPSVTVPFAEFVGFVESLRPPELDGFYLNYASHILTAVTSCLVRITLAPSSAPLRSTMELAGRLIRALRTLKKDHHWDVAFPALRRATSVAIRLGSLDEHAEFVQILTGGSTSPVSTFDLHTPIMPLNVTQTTGQTVDTTRVTTAEIAGVSTTDILDPQLLWDWGAGFGTEFDLTGGGGGLDLGLGDLFSTQAPST